MSSPKDQIKERITIEDCISSYITLFPSGKNLKAPCPFHNEKTPSFFVSPDRASFYCFGCGAKGDIFSFVEKFEGVDFYGALKILALRAGVELGQNKFENKDEKEVLYQIMENATKYFESEFQKNSTARSYLIRRGLKDETIKNFRIGFAPPEWRSVSTCLIDLGFKETDLLKVGLIKKSTKDGGKTFYDRFRGRIMFPICDSSGRVIAFSGRILEESLDEKSVAGGAKYINSTDNILFHKSNILFGIDKAKLNIRKKGYVILVEGQIDLLMSHQIGLDNTVAVSGTALSETVEGEEDKINNLGLVRRLSSNIILAFDSDKAGLRAARRSAMIAFSLEMQVKIVNLGDGRDPADIIKDDPEEWKNLIRNSKHIISFEIDEMIKRTNDGRVWSKEIRELVFPYLNMIKSKIEQAAYIKEIHDKTGIPISAIHADFDNYQKNNVGKEYTHNSPKEVSVERLSVLEKRFFSILFLLEDKEESNIDLQKFVNDLKTVLDEGSFIKMINHYRAFKDDLVTEAEIWYGNQIDSAYKDIDEVVKNLQEEILNNKAQKIMSEIRKCQRDNNKEKTNEFLKNYQDILNKIENIKSNRK